MALQSLARLLGCLEAIELLQAAEAEPTPKPAPSKKGTSDDH